MSIKAFMWILAIAAIITIPAVALVQTMNNSTPETMQSNNLDQSIVDQGNMMNSENMMQQNNTTDQPQTNTALISGKVTSLNPLIIQSESNTTYTIDTSGAKVSDWFGAESDTGKIRMGDKIWVKGTASGDRIMAEMIVNQSLPEGTTETNGKIMSVGNNSFIIGTNDSQKEITTDANTTYINNNQSASWSNVMVGKYVDVLGIEDSSTGSVTAKYINISDTAPTAAPAKK